MKYAIKEANKALKNGDVPVGAVIVENGKVIAKAYNCKEYNNKATGHAEIEVINKACRIKKTWRLDNCELYVTMEPCLMCAGAILQSRIKKIVYGIGNKKFGYVESIDSLLNNPQNNHSVDVISNICEEEIKTLVVDFFKEKRN
jgi:tRNA(adenine34) deaminase